ncbi:hypothetical protein [Rosenbergiella australiborealis]|uniref:hypothetical protein n=1 Tax=Rosenbergiella australiborealis TaxID=1544696 RepID=UPI001F4E90F8|nr:hypothetical protein [Rosenbergiella australiborealis]
MELPPEPSFTGWLLAGGSAAVVGTFLFILHASGMVRALAVFNIWWLASSPVLGWFFLFIYFCEIEWPYYALIIPISVIFQKMLFVGYFTVQGKTIILLQPLKCDGCH